MSARRVTALDLAREFKAGRSIATLARRYGLTIQQVERAIRAVMRLMRGTLSMWTGTRSRWRRGNEEGKADMDVERLMRKQKVWIVEINHAEFPRGHWTPTVGCRLTQAEARREAREWRQRNPSDAFRVRPYFAKP